jgi:hypothetical protein
MRKLLALRNLPLQMKLVGLALAGALFAFGACTSEEGVNPKCVQDVDENGNQHIPEGCNQFASCKNAAGEIVPATECCKYDNGTPFEGALLDLCLYGFGEGDIDNSSSSTTGGTGGGGGAGGGS